MAERRSERRRVVFIAAENDALAGAKVGGIADVVRDLPRAMEPLGWDPTVIVPSYGFLHLSNPSTRFGDVSFPFRGVMQTAELWRATPREGTRKSRTVHLILHHPSIAGEPIYYNDPPERVFERDAEKFALFCSAAAAALKNLQAHVVHLHDWHTGFYFLLSNLHPEFAHLSELRTVFTIHNVGYQGSRPLASLREYFPEIRSWSGWTDSRYGDPVFTPMRAAIEHADVVTTVSPSYAIEITKPSDDGTGTIGGEGLEDLLAGLHETGRLSGILNGIDYPRAATATTQWDLASVAAAEFEDGANGSPGGGGGSASPRRVSDDEALRRLRRIGEDTFVVTSVSRITSQKLSLLFRPAPVQNGSPPGDTVIEKLLSRLSGRDAVYVLLGTGEEEYESGLARIFAARPEFIFLNRFFAGTADALYRRGNLFLMPSSYEPCGISQLIAMRAGQPCLVHAVGGLKDTVIDGANGFSFSGATTEERSTNLVNAFERALGTYFNDRPAWEMIRRAAKRTRFTWRMSAQRYDEIYRSAPVFSTLARE